MSSLESAIICENIAGTFFHILERVPNSPSHVMSRRIATFFPLLELG